MIISNQENYVLKKVKEIYLRHKEVFIVLLIILLIVYIYRYQIGIKSDKVECVEINIRDYISDDGTKERAILVDGWFENVNHTYKSYDLNVEGNIAYICVNSRYLYPFEEKMECNQAGMFEFNIYNISSKVDTVYINDKLMYTNGMCIDSDFTMGLIDYQEIAYMFGENYEYMYIDSVSDIECGIDNLELYYREIRSKIINNEEYIFIYKEKNEENNYLGRKNLEDLTYNRKYEFNKMFIADQFKRYAIYDMACNKELKKITLVYINEDELEMIGIDIDEANEIVGFDVREKIVNIEDYYELYKILNLD